MPERRERERRRKRRNEQPNPIRTTDDRFQHDAAPGPGPSPYDVADPGAPSERVIRKGEPEPPGPTEPLDTGDGREYGDAALDRDAATTTGGNALAGGELRDDVGQSARQHGGDTGDPDGEELQRRLNRESRRTRVDEV